MASGEARLWLAGQPRQLCCERNAPPSRTQMRGDSTPIPDVPSRPSSCRVRCIEQHGAAASTHGRAGGHSERGLQHGLLRAEFIIQLKGQGRARQQLLNQRDPAAGEVAPPLTRPSRVPGRAGLRGLKFSHAVGVCHLVSVGSHPPLGLGCCRRSSWVPAPGATHTERHPGAEDNEPSL